MNGPTSIGLLAVVLIFSALFCGLGIDTVHATNMIFSESQITSNTASQQNPDIYEHGLYNYTIVWQDNRNGNWDIYMYAPYVDMWHPEIRITTSPSNEINPKIYNNTIVYQSDRNGNWDIYMYNLTSKVETQITNNTANQEFPAIYGNIIVWQDARTEVVTVDYNNYKHYYHPLRIYMYNLTAQTEQLAFSEYWSIRDDYSPYICGDLVVFIARVTTDVSDVRYWVFSQNISSGGNQIIAARSNYSPPVHIEGQLAYPTVYGNKIAYMSTPSRDANEGDSSWEVNMVDISTGAGYNTANTVYDGRPVIYARSSDSRYTYLVYGRTSPSPATNTNLYIYDCPSETEFRVTDNNASQIRPAISAEYSDNIVYMDNRNGNWDIYLTGFGYGVGATGPNAQSADSSSSGEATGLSYQDLTIIAVIAVVVAIVAIGVSVFVATRRGNPKNPSSASLSSSRLNKKILVIISLVLAIIIVSGVLISTLPSLFLAESGAQRIANQPMVEITSTNLRALPVEEHLAYVDVGLYNAGGDGTIIVSATISDGTDQFTGNQSLSIKEEESLNLTFTFSEISFSNFSDVHAYTWISTPESDSNDYKTMP